MANGAGVKVSNTFSKKERLNNKSLIKELFSKGSSFYMGPIKVIYLTLSRDGLSNNQVLFTIPKRIFKRAVDRNLLKRRMREAYRLHKSILSLPQNQIVLIAYIYIGKEIAPYSLLEEKLVAGLCRLEKKLNEN